MRYENQGILLWYGLPDTPVPRNHIPPAQDVFLTIGVSPAHPSNQVKIICRVNGGSPQVIAAKPTRRLANNQYFVARLPASWIGPGDVVRYGAICHCGGRQVPATIGPDELSSSFRVAGVTRAATIAPADGANPAVPTSRGLLDKGVSASAPAGSGGSNTSEGETEQTLPGTPTNTGSVSEGQSPKDIVTPSGPVTRPSSAGPPITSHPGTRISTPVPPTTVAVSAPPDALPQSDQGKNAGPTLLDLAPSLSPGSSQLVSQLAGRGIRTLEDVRQAGGVTNLVSPGVAATARLIDAHADLARISIDLVANGALISAGFDSTLRIARSAQVTFLTAAAPVLGTTSALRIHATATAMYHALDQVLTGARVDAANGVGAGFSAPTNNTIYPTSDQPCQCCDCQNSQSPAAYLVDLLAYVVQHLLNHQQPIDLDFLVNTFHQPFGDLPTDCEAVEQQVRQVRLCIEVLRSYLGASHLSATAESAYELAAYSALLLGIGTTYEELRLARHADATTRYALAERLGLTVDPYSESRPDELDWLLMDPTKIPSSAQPQLCAPMSTAYGPWCSLDQDLTEMALERFFGLADTTRNPLSDGQTINDSGQQITRWNVNGAVWGRNTDKDGIIYVSVDHANIATSRVSLYKDAARSQLVASGTQAISGGTVTGPITLGEEYSSGLAGQFEIAVPTENATLAVAAIPLVTCWQLQTLRLQWQSEDHPTDAYADGASVVSLTALPSGLVFPPALQSRIQFDTRAKILTFTGVMGPSDYGTLTSLSQDGGYLAAIQALYVQSQRPPVIDPDVIGPDDFRVPVPKLQAADPDQPFDVWLRRRVWVDTQLGALAGMTKPLNGAMVPDLKAMLDSMYIGVTYGAVTLAPWNTTTPLSALENLWENLGEGVSVEVTRNQIAADLGFSIDAFNRLMDLKHQDEAAALDSRNPPVSNAEWTEVCSILVEAAKRRFFSAWRSEETALLLLPPLPLLPPPWVLFSSQTFVVSLHEPALGNWPPLIPVKQPVIDPALVALTDLPEPTLAARDTAFWQARSATAFWLARSTQRIQITQDLRTTQETSGLQSALTQALGNPLPVDLDLLAQQLVDPDPQVVAAATATIQSTLFMSVEDFNQLMSIRAADADPNPLLKPTAADWLALYEILTAAEVRRSWYPVWLNEESSAGVTYWTARKAKLPLWRASTDQRAQWHTALAQRSSPPIIDPDVVGPSDFVNPVSGDPAFDLWQARTNWLQPLLNQTNPTNIGEVDTAITAALGIKGTDLVDLSQQEAAGTDVSTRLAQLGLTPNAFDTLVGIRSLKEGGVPVLPAEWDTFWSILAQCMKQLRFPVWLQDEAAQNILLGPDSFQPPDLSPTTIKTSTVALPEWRATTQVRQDWEDTLNARVEQQNTTIAALQAVVDKTEGETLTSLRDALVLATNAPGADLKAKADWLTKNLLIDAETDGCQKTTRVEQAIETLQTLMTSVRNGQIGTLDIILTSAPAATYLDSSLHVFARGFDGAVWHKWRDADWHDWESLGGFATSAPAVTSVMSGRLDLFVRGPDNALWHEWWDGDWHDWESWGGYLLSGPSVISPELGNLMVFVVGPDGNLWQLSGQFDSYQNAMSWGSWQPAAKTATLPASGITSAPAVVARDINLYDAFARGGDTLWWAGFDGNWSGWFSLGGSLNPDTGFIPAALSAAPSSIDIFAIGQDQQHHVWYLPRRKISGVWSGAWTNLGGFATAGVAVASAGNASLDVFVAGPDARLWHKRCDDSSTGIWHDWEGVSGLTLSDPSNFDEEWKWMGSYESWRSAILVSEHPEDILDPALRKWQTPAFQRLVSNVNANTSLTAQQARDEASKYSDYFRDVCSITVETSCMGDASTLFMFGLAGNSKKAYWSTYFTHDTSGYAQSFWDVVPGLASLNLTSLFGSAWFVSPAGPEFIYLFFLASEGNGPLKLGFVRYNQSQDQWDGQSYSLTFPDGWSVKSAQLGVQQSLSDPPRIVLILGNGSAYYERQLNADGNDWSDIDWVQVGAWQPWTRGTGANVKHGQITAVSRIPDQIDLFWVDSNDGSIWSAISNAHVNGGKLSSPYQIDPGFSGKVDSVVSAVVRTPHSLDVLAVEYGTNGTIYANWWDANKDNAQWHSFQPISQPGFGKNGYIQGVAGVALAPDRLDVVAVVQNQDVQHTWWDGNWHDWGPVTGSFTTATQPILVARGSQRFDVFAVDYWNAKVWQNIFSISQGWLTWQSIDLPVAPYDPAYNSRNQLLSVARTKDVVDLLFCALAQNDSILESYWNWSDLAQNNGNWHQWVQLDQDPAMTQDFVYGSAFLGRMPTHLDAFLWASSPSSTQTNPSYVVKGNWWDSNIDNGAKWQQWYAISPGVSQINSGGTQIAAISRIPNRIDLFIAAADGIYTTYYQDVDFGPPNNPLPPNQSYAPIATIPSHPQTPVFTIPLDIPEYLSSQDLQVRRAQIRLAFEINAGTKEANLTYLKEAYYFVPMYLGAALDKCGQYTAALDFYRTVYDYSMPVSVRDIYYEFEEESKLSSVTQRSTDWLLDPLDPHLIAAARRYSYKRYTVLCIVQCLCDFGDSRFTYDTPESDAEARTLYMTALDLLALDIFDQSSRPCDGLSISLPQSSAADDQWAAANNSLSSAITTLGSVSAASAAASQMQHLMAENKPPADRFAAARSLIAEAKRQSQRRRTTGQLVAGRDAYLTRAYNALLTEPPVNKTITSVITFAGNSFDATVTAPFSGGVQPVSPAGPNGGMMSTSAPNMLTLPPTVQDTLGETSVQLPSSAGVGGNLVPHEVTIPIGGGTTPMVNYWFCTPPDPLLNALRMHATLNLYKLRHCMNIAGVYRDLDPYSGAFSLSDGQGTNCSSAQPQVSGRVAIQPTPYSYPVLLARAKQLVQVATQMEASMLTALEKYYAAAYDELQARQNLDVANATVKLQNLTLAQANDGVTLAQLQGRVAQTQMDHFQQLMQSDIGSLEQQAIDAQTTEAELQVTASAASFAAAAAGTPSLADIATFGANTLSTLASGFSSLANSFGTYAAINQARASYEAQQSDWQYQYDLGVDNAAISAQQVVLANDQVSVASQQLQIAQLQATQKSDIVTFLANKFTNANLYYWMSGVLQGVYSYFLHEATAVARMAENQMAFERQEVPPGFIKADYWQAPTGMNTGTPAGTPNVLGLTGAERLSQDLTELDEYYAQTNKRKLQLTKTYSLAQLNPIEFQRLRDTGVMHFTTSLADFDKDFPGHYLRLIQQVRVSVIALIPPTQGVNATLSTTAATRAVIGPDVFQKVVVRRDPQSISINSPTNATGVFSPDPQAELLMPFQGLGVEAQWEFRMPKAANQCDYSSLADVLIAYDYTALDNSDYRVQVLRSLGGETSLERPYSFRNDLADQWYDFNNPDQSATPMTVQFTTSRSDFPPNLEDLRIRQVILYFSRADGATFEVAVRSFSFSESGNGSSVGGAATSVGGVISTRRGNAASWMPMIGKAPFGTWTLALPNTQIVREWFANGGIQEILFDLTYSARTPAWPA